MKAAELRKKSAADLSKLLAEKESALSAFRFGMSGGRTKNVRTARALRKEIARIRTIVHEHA